MGTCGILCVALYDAYESRARRPRVTCGEGQDRRRQYGMREYTVFGARPTHPQSQLKLQRVVGCQRTSIHAHPVVPLGYQDASPTKTAVNTSLLTIDISALARNFCTAFFLSSLSAGSLFALIDDVACGMIVVACKYEMGGDAEDVAEDDGVAMRLVVVLDSIDSACRCMQTMSSLVEDSDGGGC